MLRITVAETSSEETWVLQGQLTGEFAIELHDNWQMAVDKAQQRLRIVDLSDVTLIDKDGKEVLLQMIRQEARFIATGLYTRHLLAELHAHMKDEPEENSPFSVKQPASSSES
jgi:ABC-type transporter Mla MlaB component